MGFKGIVGHEDIIAHFKSSIETGNVAHAYIISGDAGSGKKALAYACLLYTSPSPRDA